MKRDLFACAWLRAMALFALASLFLGCTGIGVDTQSGEDETSSPSGTVSTDLSLSALTVNGRSLSPSLTTQPLGEIIPYSATEVSVTATPTDSAAMVTVSGNTKLSNVAGKTDIMIVVMSSDKQSSKTYTVTAAKEGAALEFPVSCQIAVSDFTVSGTCYGDVPEHVLVSFGGMEDIEASVDATAMTWSAVVHASAIANGLKKQLTVETKWSKGSHLISRDFSYSGSSAPGHSISGTLTFASGVPIPTGEILVISATQSHGSVSSQVSIPVTSAASYAYTLTDLAPGTYRINAYHYAGDGSPRESYKCCSSGIAIADSDLGGQDFVLVVP